jgi:hypothetical protein
VLTAHGIVISMCRAGDCNDNTLAERCFATRKADFVDRQVWPTRQAARQALFAWIAVCSDRQRLHSALCCCAPATCQESEVPMVPAASRYTVQKSGAAPHDPAGAGRGGASVTTAVARRLAAALALGTVTAS